MELRRSVLVPYSAEDMFDLIEQAENYPQFLPWCTSATIFERTDEVIHARLDFSYMKFKFGFETRNPKRRPESLQVRLVSGPFKRMETDWTLTPVGGIGCRISFYMAYEISDNFFNTLARPAVDAVSRSMLDAFVKRAQATLKEMKPSLPAAVPVEGLPPVPPQTVLAPVPESIPAPAAAPEPAQTPAPSPVPAEAAAVANSGESVMTATPLIEALRASPLAPELNEEQVVALAAVMRLVTLPAKAVVEAEGSVDNRLVVVVDGSLGVIKSIGTADEAVLNTLRPGDFAHELGFLDGAARYSSLVALTDARVLTLEREALESLLDSHPRIVYRVMCAIVRVVHRIQSRQSVQASELTNYIVKQHGRY